MTLMLHVGAEPIEYGELQTLPVPQATPTHVPLPHHQLVDMVKYALGYYGHEVVEEHHGVTKEGDRYFGLLNLKSTYGGYTDTLGLRNSHDKSFPIGIAFGSRVFVCDNLAFSADTVIKRKHTAHSKRDLPAIVAQLVEPLQEQRKAQAITFDRFKATDVSDEIADQTIMRLYRDGVINVTRIADVVREWDEPSFEEFQDGRTAWRLFNAATYALNGRVAENPQATQKLHQVIDGVCQRLN